MFDDEGASAGRLDDMVAIVTGGGRGIANRFARRRVVIATRTRSSGGAGADEIERAGGAALAIARDVSDEWQVQSTIAPEARHGAGAGYVLLDDDQSFCGGGRSNHCRPITEHREAWCSTVLARSCSPPGRPARRCSPTCASSDARSSSASA